MLDIIDLAKTLPGGRALFSGLSLTLAAGEYVAIMGESGVGKSTLLNLIAGLDPADAGEIRHCCSPTNRPTTSTPTPPATCWPCCATSFGKTAPPASW